MKRAEKKLIEDERWLSLIELQKKQLNYLMSLEEGTEEYKEAQQAFKETSEILQKFEEENKKLAFEKRKLNTTVAVRCGESVISVLGMIIYIGYEATNSMTSKWWPIVSKKLSSLGLFSTTNI